jgi:hypothetical protein
MAEPVNVPHRSRGPLVVVLASATLLSAVAASQVWVSRSRSNEITPIWQALLSGLAPWFLWAMVTPAILALGRRFGFQRGRVRVSLLVHGLTALVWGTVHTLVSSTIQWWLFRSSTNGEPFPVAEVLSAFLLGTRVQLAMLTYFAIVGLGRAADALGDLAERERHALRLEAQLNTARLEALTLRLQPHFIFNTLHAIGVLVREDPPTAERMVTRLGDLLRATLTSSRDEVSLEEELRLLGLYLEIEQTRFADRLQVEPAIDPGVMRARVPVFLLQPIVENAITHGIASRAAGGRLVISAGRVGDVLEIRIWNDGVLAAGGSDRVGLGTTRERLATRYAGRASLTLGADGTGVRTTMRLPWDAVHG